MTGAPAGSSRDARCDALLCAALRGVETPWPETGDPAFGDALLRRAVFHRVHVLLHDGAMRGGPAARWPAGARAALATAARLGVAEELWRSRDLPRVLAALADGGVEALVLKGAALAHRVYASPALRPRADADLLVHPRERARAESILAGLGYERGHRIAGRHVEHQAPWRRHRDGGPPAVVDLHWRVFNRAALAAALPWDGLRARAVPLPRLAPGARGAGDVDALLLACAHGAAHHAGQPRPLVWLYDVHLLASRLSPTAWDELAGRARREGLRALCASSLAAARRRLGTPLPPRIAAALREGADEPSARLLDDGRELLWEDLRAVRGGWRKLAFLREAALPAPAFLRERYGAKGSAALPWLYLRRGAEGLRRRWSRR